MTRIPGEKPLAKAKVLACADSQESVLPKRPKQSRLGARLPRRGSLPDISHETSAGYPRLLLAGADEVGRGCLAGPVVAAALVLPDVIDYSKHPWLSKVHDSKKVTAEVRAELEPLIRAWAQSVAVAQASVEEIDSINIYHASHLAILRAIEQLRPRPDHVLIDGKWLPPGMPIPATAVIKGDAKCLSIAAASIVAKVHRDRLMQHLHEEVPHYGFAKHKGYPTPDHKRALQERGISKYHRKSFKLLVEPAVDC